MSNDSKCCEVNAVDRTELRSEGIRDQASKVLKRVRIQGDRLRDLGDLLFGATPSAGTADSEKQPCGDGVYDQIDVTLSKILSQLEINDELVTRLEA